MHSVPVANLGSRAVTAPSVAGAYQTLLTRRMAPTSAGSSSMEATAVSTSRHGCTLAPASILQCRLLLKGVCSLLVLWACPIRLQSNGKPAWQLSAPNGFNKAKTSWKAGFDTPSIFLKGWALRFRDWGQPSWKPQKYGERRPDAEKPQSQGIPQISRVCCADLRDVGFFMNAIGRIPP